MLHQYLWLLLWIFYSQPWLGILVHDKHYFLPLSFFSLYLEVVMVPSTFTMLIILYHKGWLPRWGWLVLPYIWIFCYKMIAIKVSAFWWLVWLERYRMIMIFTTSTFTLLNSGCCCYLDVQTSYLLFLLLLFSYFFILKGL